MNGIEGEKRDEIMHRQLCHFFRMDVEFGLAVALELGINVDAIGLGNMK